MSVYNTLAPVVLEPAAQAFVEATPWGTGLITRPGGSLRAVHEAVQSMNPAAVWTVIAC